MAGATGPLAILLLGEPACRPVRQGERGPASARGASDTLVPERGAKRRGKQPRAQGEAKTAGGGGGKRGLSKNRDTNFVFPFLLRRFCVGGPTLAFWF